MICLNMDFTDSWGTDSSLKKSLADNVISLLSRSSVCDHHLRRKSQADKRKGKKCQNFWIIAHRFLPNISRTGPRVSMEVHLSHVSVTTWKPRFDVELQVPFSKNMAPWKACGLPPSLLPPPTSPHSLWQICTRVCGHPSLHPRSSPSPHSHPLAALWVCVFMLVSSSALKRTDLGKMTMQALSASVSMGLFKQARNTECRS